MAGPAVGSTRSRLTHKRHARRSIAAAQKRCDSLFRQSRFPDFIASVPSGQALIPVGSRGLGNPDLTRRGIMLTRRDFAGFASCAICAVTGFAASDASAAEGVPPPVTPGLTRKMLAQMDGPMPGYVTLNMEVEIEAGTIVPRHTHPGVESSYVLEGGFELPIQGQPTRMLKPGDGFQIPPETPHAGGKPGDKKTRVAITYVVEKGKPLASPA
jgi:quercetin dioxygenase-like cupin family protein